MASTYTLISSQVLASSASSVTFSSIPATYTDLALRCSLRNDDTGRADVYLNINGTTGTNYSATNLRGSGAAATSGRYSSSANFTFLQSDSSSNTGNTFGSLEIYFPNYAATAVKPISAFGTQEDNSASTNTWIVANAMLYNNSTAITSLAVGNAPTINYVTGSSFYLYGISNA